MPTAQAAAAPAPALPDRDACGLTVDGARARIVVHGPLAGRTVFALHATVTAALRQPIGTLELDLGAAGPVMAEGLAALVVTRRRLRAAATVLVLSGVADGCLPLLARLGLVTGPHVTHPRREAMTVSDHRTADTPPHRAARPADGTVPPLHASARLTAALQAVLVDLVELHLQAKQAHWNVVGDGFRAAHRQLDDIVDRARELADSVAERMRALGVVPDGRTDTVSATATLPVLPGGELDVPHAGQLMVDRLRLTSTTARRVHDDVEAEDPASTDLLHLVILELEKAAWMLAAENRGRAGRPDDH